MKKMKACKFVLLILIFLLFCNGSCEHEEGQRFIIHNNSDKEIVVVYSSFPMNNECFIGGNETKMEYENFMYNRAIKSHSNKNFSRLTKSIINRFSYQDTTYFYVFNRIDMDTMSCEEFEEKFPLKHEWRVTLADVKACDWILVYPQE